MCAGEAGVCVSVLCYVVVDNTPMRTAVDAQAGLGPFCCAMTGRSVISEKEHNVGGGCFG